jgi:hypothetical protein
METNNYGYVTKDWIIENNPLYLERIIFKPIGLLNEMNSLIEYDIVRYYRDGRVERKSLYTAAPAVVDGTTILSPFGNKVIEEKKRKGDMERNDECNNFCCE